MVIIIKKLEALLLIIFSILFCSFASVIVERDRLSEHNIILRK
jgi:hypothetical protein